MQGEVAQSCSDCLHDFEAGLAALRQQLVDSSTAAAQAQVGCSRPWLPLRLCCQHHFLYCLRHCMCLYVYLSHINQMHSHTCYQRAAASCGLHSLLNVGNGFAFVVLLFPSSPLASAQLLAALQEAATAHVARLRDSLAKVLSALGEQCGAVLPPGLDAALADAAAASDAAATGRIVQQVAEVGPWRLECLEECLAAAQGQNSTSTTEADVWYTVKSACTSITAASAAVSCVCTLRDTAASADCVCAGAAAARWGLSGSSGRRCAGPTGAMPV